MPYQSYFIHVQVCPTPLLSFYNVLSHEFHFSYRPEKFDQLANEHIVIVTSVTVNVAKRVSGIGLKLKAEKSSVKKPSCISGQKRLWITIYMFQIEN